MRGRASQPHSPSSAPPLPRLEDASRNRGGGHAAQNSATRAPPGPKNYQKTKRDRQKSEKKGPDSLLAPTLLTISKSLGVGVSEPLLCPLAEWGPRTHPRQMTWEERAPLDCRFVSHPDPPTLRSPPLHWLPLQRTV